MGSSNVRIYQVVCVAFPLQVLTIRGLATKEKEMVVSNVIRSAEWKTAYNTVDTPEDLRTRLPFHPEQTVTEAQILAHFQTLLLNDVTIKEMDGNTTLNTAYIVPVITTTTCPAGTIGTAYTRTLASTGTSPFVWAVSIGTLPAGLTLNTSTGVISGTPTTTGTSSFTVSATNGGGSDTQALSIVIA